MSCRCGTYPRIVAAVQLAEKLMNGGQHALKRNVTNCLKAQPIASRWSAAIFFKLLGGGLVFLLICDDPASAQESGRGRARSGEALPQTIGGWLHIGEDGAVTVYTGKVEMGQNIRTSLAQAVAEELHAPIASISLVMGDTDLTPFDMGTFGSRTTPTMAPQLKKVGAAARETMIDLATEKWKVERASVSVVDGKVKNSATGESIGFGALTHGQQLLKTVDGAAVTPADKWTVAGTSVPKTTARDIVTGAHRFTSDIVRPNMRYGPRSSAHSLQRQAGIARL